MMTEEAGDAGRGAVKGGGGRLFLDGWPHQWYSSAPYRPKQISAKTSSAGKENE